MASWKSLTKRAGSGARSGSVNQVYDPKIQIQILAKMSRFQNPAFVTQVSVGERGALGLHSTYVRIDATCHHGREQRWRLLHSSSRTAKSLLVSSSSGPFHLSSKQTHFPYSTANLGRTLVHASLIDFCSLAMAETHKAGVERIYICIKQLNCLQHKNQKAQKAFVNKLLIWLLFFCFQNMMCSRSQQSFSAAYVLFLARYVKG